jgi:hypothetical protein
MLSSRITPMHVTFSLQPGTPTWHKSAIKTECETRGSLAFFTGDAMDMEEVILAEVESFIGHSMSSSV